MSRRFWMRLGIGGQYAHKKLTFGEVPGIDYPAADSITDVKQYLTRAKIVKRALNEITELDLAHMLRDLNVKIAESGYQDIEDEIFSTFSTVDALINSLEE